MEPKVVLANIERLLKVRGLSADKASRLAKRPDAIRNLKKKVKQGGGGSLRADTLAALADVLRTTVDDLQRSDRPVPQAPIPGLRDYLLSQRDLIDQQLADLDEAERAAKKAQKRKNR